MNQNLFEAAEGRPFPESQNTEAHPPDHQTCDREHQIRILLLGQLVVKGFVPDSRVEESIEVPLEIRQAFHLPTGKARHQREDQPERSDDSLPITNSDFLPERIQFHLRKYCLELGHGLFQLLLIHLNSFAYSIEEKLRRILTVNNNEINMLVEISLKYLPMNRK